MCNFQKENTIKILLCVAITHLTHVIKKNLNYQSKEKEVLGRPLK
jgi:hypothetical protein